MFTRMSVLDAELLRTLLRVQFHGERAARFGCVVTHECLADGVFETRLQSPFQGTGTILHVVALLADEVLGLLCEQERVSHVVDASLERTQFDVHDAADGLLVQLVEVDDVIQSVEELRRKLLLQGLLHQGTGQCLVL